jgi:TPP-dependent pyruvate/acetoin dehydrogenase alpha subunit
MEERLSDAAVLDAIDKEVSAEVDDAFAFALASPEPGLDELLIDVFASESEVPR